MYTLVIMLLQCKIPIYIYIDINKCDHLVKKSVGVQMLTIFACVYSNSIATAAISMGEGFLAFLFFLQIPPTNQYFWCTLHENYIFNKWKKYDVFYNGNLSTSFATSSILWWFFLVALSIRHMKGLDNHLFICLVFHRSFPLSWLYA